MTSEADIKHYTENLIGTLDKKLTMQMLREWRAEARDKGEATVLTDILAEIRSGSLDG